MGLRHRHYPRNKLQEDPSVSRLLIGLLFFNMHASHRYKSIERSETKNRGEKHEKTSSKFQTPSSKPGPKLLDPASSGVKCASSKAITGPTMISERAQSGVRNSNLAQISSTLSS